MKTCADFRSLITLIALGSFLFAQPSHAIFGWFSDDEKPAPTKEERAAQDRAAAPIFAQADQWAKGGNHDKAIDLHKRIAKKYPYSQYAAESQFLIGEYELATGDFLKSFDAYQQLIDIHRGSNHFKQALEQQYNIAVRSLTEKTGSLFGVKRYLAREKVVEMFEQIVKNAPSSILAANSHYYVGRIFESDNKPQPAVAAYQKVVENFPNSEKAPQAQLRIGQLLGTSAPRSDNPVNLRQSREAYEDFITQFPEHEDRSEALAQLDAISEREARKSLQIAKFYEKQGKAKAAAIYYSEVLRSEDAALKQEARQRLNVISQAHPDALKMAKIDQSVTTTPPHERLKNQDNYFGPPAPDLVSAPPVEKPQMRMEEEPVTPVEEPALPEVAPNDTYLDLDSIIPPGEPFEGEDPLDFVLPALEDMTEEEAALEEVPEAPAPPTEEELPTVEEPTPSAEDSGDSEEATEEKAVEGEEAADKEAAEDEETESSGS